ncbi:hypothetical protein L7F22_040112 [Adiantum nelumboides]|nr:hypothetical protein [Adiantum nelumboides]
MRGLTLLSVLAFASGVAAQSNAACDTISKQLGASKVQQPLSLAYTSTTNDYWNKQQALNKPACVVQPNSTADVSAAVKAIRSSNATMAVKAAGHNTNNFWSSTNGGVLLDLTKMTGKSFDATTETATYQPGSEWGDLAHRPKHQQAAREAGSDTGRDGRHFFVALLVAGLLVAQQRGADPHARPGQRRQDDDPLQAPARRCRVDDSDHCFNVESLSYKNIKFQVWDLGGQSSIRPYWRCYYADTSAIIYVVDSADKERLSTSRTELLSMLSEEELANAKLLVLANKQDLPGAASAAEVSERLGLDKLKDRSWSIQACTATEGKGLEEGLDWCVIAMARFLSFLAYLSLFVSLFPGV